MKQLDLIAAILVVIGAINWGLVGLVQVDLVSLVFGTTILTRLVFILVGLAGLYQIVQWSGLLTHGHHPAIT